MKQLEYIYRWYADDARSRGELVRPRLLNFPVTDTCNARCIMCDIWKENASDDMSLEQIGKVLEQPFFQDLEHIGISGGEPFLRPDLVEIVETFSRLPKVKSLSITSHGFNTSRHKAMGLPIAQLLQKKDIHFTMNVSIDGVGVIHDRVRRVPGGFVKLEQIISHYKQNGVAVLGQCTVSRENLYGLSELNEYSQENNLDIIYRLATTIERLDNSTTIDAVALNAKEKSFFADFLSHSGVIEGTKNPARRLFYRQLVETLRSGRERKAPCYFQNEAVLLAANGLMYQCSIVEEAIGNALNQDMEDEYFSSRNRERLADVKEAVCKTCVHDQSGAWHPRDLVVETLAGTGIGKQIARAPDLEAKARSVVETLTSSTIKPAALAKGGTYPSALVIGCYGGEHVGDAAILGGVLLRLSEANGVKRAIVLSSRVDRTQGWVDCLKLPIDVRVAQYDDQSVETEIPYADIAVIAGGPIMDLPALLAQHFHVAKKAAGRGIPFIAEGIGLGPFRREISRSLAGKLLASSSAATFRTQTAYELGRAWTDDATQTIDPAFTYLESLSGCDERIPEFLSKIKAKGKPLIGLNLRPLWTRYANKQFGEREVAEIGAKVSQSIAEVILSNPQYDFVFLPFNSDQLGMSDLTEALRLKKLLAGQYNYFVWEAEPDIEELVGALSVCDALIAMRFHACIFGLATGVPTMGIDYGIGKRSKVHELIADNSCKGACLPAEAFTSESANEWLHQTLNR